MRNKWKIILVATVVIIALLLTAGGAAFASDNKNKSSSVSTTKIEVEKDGKGKSGKHDDDRERRNGEREREKEREHERENDREKENDGKPTPTPAPPPAPTVPAAASGLTAAAVNATQVNLNWTDNSSDETGFRIERTADSGFTGLTSFTVAANVTAYNDTTVVANTTYFYRVIAYNGVGDAAPSNTASATTPEPPPAPTVPAAASGLTATAASATLVNLSWTDNSNNETGFRIERATNDGFTGLTSFTVAANVTSHSDTTAVASTTYFYRVIAYNTVGDASPSNTASATTPAPPPAPTVPAAASGLTAAAVSATQVNLGWTDNSNNETGFRIERATNDGFTGMTSFTVAANVTAYSDTTLVASTTYYYRVIAYNGVGDASPSDTASATTPAPPLDGAAIYAANCTFCHGVKSTSMTQAQLINWIPNHNTGGSLTAAQVAAVAAYLKP